MAEGAALNSWGENWVGGWKQISFKDSSVSFFTYSLGLDYFSTVLLKLQCK